VKQVRNVYFKDEFGSPEAIWELEVVDFPAVVTIDAHGNSLHKDVLERSQAELAA
jgi:tartrate dehydratase beta subunit/fumarate hydratase class I family protein